MRVRVLKIVALAPYNLKIKELSFKSKLKASRKSRPRDVIQIMCSLTEEWTTWHNFGFKSLQLMMGIVTSIKLKRLGSKLRITSTNS